MSKWFFAALFLLAALSGAPGSSPFVGGVYADEEILHVTRGQALRRTLLDSARPTFVADTRGDVQFVVRRLTRWGPWAYARVLPQRPTGRPIDWSKTYYADIHAAGDLDGGGESDVLLIRQGDGWVVHEYAIGPTDVVWEAWREVYRLPLALFVD